MVKNAIPRKKTLRLLIVCLLVLAAAAHPMTVFAASETEPNNKLGLANPVTPGGEVTAAFDPVWDSDWYQITLPSPGRLSLSVLNPPADVRAYIELYNRHADYLWVRNHAVNEGDEVHLSYDAVEPGTYFIRLSDYDNNTGSSDTYTFKTAFTPVSDAQEPNNVPGHAFLLTARTVTGTIFSNNDSDFFKIYAASGDTLRLTVNSPQEMISYLEFYDPNLRYMWVRARAVNPGDTLILEHAVQTSGIYTIRLSDFFGRPHTETYTLTIAGGQPGVIPPQNPVTTESEDNGDLGLANQAAIGTSVSGAVSIKDDQDWFRLEVPKTGQLTIDITQIPAAIQLHAHLYDSSRNQVLYGQSTDPGKTFSLIFDVPRPDTWYLMFTNADGNVFSSDQYVFKTALVEVNDPYELNNDYGDASLMTQLNRREAYIFPTGDHDWHKINVTQHGELKIILSNLPGNIRPGISLYNLSKEYLTGKGGTAGTDMDLVYPVSEPGTYLVQITDYGDQNESTEPYTLTINGADFAAYAPVARIDQITPGSIIVGNAIAFKGSGTDIDGSITGYHWRSSIDGFLSSQAAFTTTALSIGTHTIWFKVQDNDGIGSTEVSEVIYVGSSVSDEAEPNTPIGLANEIGTDLPVKARINAGGDEDYFKIYINRPGHLVFSATNVPKNLRLYLELWNRHLDYLWVRKAAVADGDDVLLPFDVVEPGFYYLRITDQDQNFNNEFTYTLKAVLDDAVDSHEPNNSLLDARPLTQASINGYIFPGGDQDFYKVWVNAGSTLTASLTQMPGNIRPYIHFYDRDRNYMWVRKAANNEGDGVQLSHTFQEAGFIYILVQDADNDLNWEQTYTLTLTGAVPGYTPAESPLNSEQEYNGGIADANLIALNTGVAGIIGENGDSDWFKFPMTTPGIIHADLTGPGPGMRGRMRVYQDDKAQINAADATNTGDDLFLDTRITMPGMYYIAIENANGTGSPDHVYTLAVSATIAQDGFEPNNLFGDAAPLKDLNRVHALIFDRSDEDWYRVKSEAGSVLRVTVADVPFEIRPQIDIYDHNKNNIAYKAASNDGQELSLSHNIEAAADYFIRISDSGNNSFSTNFYTLVITGAQFNDYVPLAFIDSISPNPVSEGGEVVLEGHGEDSDGDIIGYAWRSSIDRTVSNSRVFRTTTLSPGVHTIGFSVKDNDQNWSPETRTILYVGLTTQEQEPNNEIGEANPMEYGLPYTGSLQPGNEGDFFRIHVPEPGRLTFSASNPTGSQMKTYLEMYTLDADYAWVRVAANNAGEPVTLIWDVTEPGEYYLRVSDNNNVNGSQYSVTAQFQAPADPYESNHDFIRAAPLRSGETVTGRIFPAGDKDMYKITTTIPGSLRLSLTHMPDDLKGYIETWDKNLVYTWIRKAANNGGDDVFLNYDITEPGTYFFQISHYDNNVSNPVSPYTLNAAFIPAPDRWEPNSDLRTSALITDLPIEAYIFPQNDADFYKFYAEIGTRLDMTVDNVPANLRPYLELYNPNLEYMWVRIASPADGAAVTLAHDVTESGYYYLRVSDADADYSPEFSYRLTVSGANPAYTPPGPVNAEAEPNHAFKNATRISTNPVTGTFAAGDDNDWFCFKADEPGDLIISLTVPASIQSEIHLYDASKTHHAARTAENSGEFSELKFPVTTPGLWYVQILPVNNASSAETYQLVVALDPARDMFEPNPSYGDAAPIALGQTVQPLIFSKDDNDWFQLETGEPGIIRFEMTDIPENIQITMQLHDQNNNTLMVKEALNGGESLEADHLVMPGIYYLVVYDRGSDAYSLSPYTLRTSFTPQPDMTEPNNRFSNAALLKAANQAAGMIHPLGDDDWYRFHVAAPGILKVQMTETDGILPRMYLYNDSKTLLKTLVAENPGDGLTMTCEITRPDLYYLMVRAEGGNAYSFRPYVLTIEGGDFSDYYPTAQIESLNPNPVITGQEITLRGSGHDDGGGTERTAGITAYEWASDRDGALGNGPGLPLSTLSKGDHRISLRVRDSDGHWSGRVYQYAYVTDAIQDEAEYNNSDTFTDANPVLLNQWVRGAVMPEEDRDHYKIYIPQQGKISALVDALPRTMRAYIEFWDEGQNYLWIRNEAANPGDRVVLTFFTDPGWYYVRISDSAGLGHSDTYAVRFGFEPAQDRHEPNDSASEAASIPPDTAITDAFISKGGDVDWYRVEIPGAGRLSLSLTQMPENLRGYIELYNADLDYMWVRQSAFHDGEDVFLNYDAGSPGVYYITVRDYDNNRAATLPYRFTSQFTPVNDVHEANPDAVQAALLSAAGIADAYIFPGGDADWFKIYAAAGQRLNLSVTHAVPEMRPGIHMYDANLGYTWVREFANNPGDDIYLVYDVPENGMYYILVQDEDNRSHTGGYRLTVTGGTPNYEPPLSPVASEDEPNPEYANANDIALNTHVRGIINPADESDWYRFYVNSSGILTISHTNIPTGITSEMWIYDTNKTQIAYRTTTNPGENNDLIMTVTRGGYYYIRLRDRDGNNSSTAEYALRVSHEPVVDAHEPNNGFGSASWLGQNTVQGYIFDHTDQDWYRLYIRQAGTLTVSVDAMPSQIRPHIQLYNADRLYLKEWLATNEGQTGAEVMVHNLGGPGFCYLQIYDEGQDSYAGSPYTLRITGADFSSAPLLDPIGNRVIDETIPYEMVIHAADPDNPKDLTYTASHLPPGAEFDSASRTFKWTPARGQTGPFSGIHFQVSDGTYTDSEDITITVNRVNRAPVLSPIGDQTACIGTLLTFQVSASDPDAGDTLTYTAEHLPTGAGFNPSERRFSWTPAGNQAGIHTDLLFKVTDGNRTDFEYMDIEVVSVIRGDVNGDTKVDLADALLALQIMTGSAPQGAVINLNADVNGDGRIGAAEVIYILETVINLR
jgi:hypothetical protein